MQADYARSYRSLWERHWWWRSREAFLLAWIGRLHSRRPRRRILDVGCGDGLFFDRLQRFGQVEGIEPDASLVHDPRWRPQIKIAPLEPGSFAPDAYDLVLMLDVLEHIADDASAVREIARVLRPGGVFVFSVPAHPWLWSAHDVALWHQRRYRRGELIRLLRGAGLEPRWLSYWNAVLFPVVAARRVLTPRRRDTTAVSDTALPSAPVNAVLTGVLRVEARALGWLRFPFGVSLVGVATPSTH
jgi:SAM-dependent methyltransferase